MANHLPPKCWIKHDWRQNIAIEIRSFNRSSSTGRSATPQKRNNWTPTMELEMMQVSYFGAALIPQSHKGYSRKFKVSTKKKAFWSPLKKTAQCPTFLIYNMFIPKKKWWGETIVVSSAAATFKTQRTQKRLQSYEAHVDQRNQEAFKAWSFDPPVSAGGLRPTFSKGWSCWFFSGCTFKWKETDIWEINRDCGRKFLCSFFFEILMVVFLLGGCSASPKWYLKFPLWRFCWTKQIDLQEWLWYELEV